MASDLERKVMDLTRRYGFKPTNVVIRGNLGTIIFDNQKGEANRWISQLRPAMKQMGVPESAMKAREVHHPAEGGEPEAYAGVVEIDFSRMLQRNSRPGTPARFAVEDRFYFGKGRKERFAEPREIEAKIRAWIDSRGLPIGSQETNALSYIAAQHMLRGGVSIEQAVKSAARRHAQMGLASAGLRTWLEGNA